MSASVEERLDHAEAQLALKALMHTYSNLCDRGFDPERMSALFTDDGVWDGGDEVGRFEGRDAVKAFLAGLAKVVTWSGHFVVNDEFTVSGGNAHGFWRCIAMVNNPGEAVEVDKFYFQDYHFECVRDADGWKFKSIRTDLRKATAYRPFVSGQTPVTRED